MNDTIDIQIDYSKPGKKTNFQRRPSSPIPRNWRYRLDQTVWPSNQVFVVQHSSSGLTINSKAFKRPVNNKLMSRIADEIKKFASLEPNWNGYDAPSVNRDLVALNLSLSEGLEFLPNISITSDSMIQYDYSRGEDFIEVEVFEEGIIVYKVEKGDEVEYEANHKDFSRVLNEFYRE